MHLPGGPVDAGDRGVGAGRVSGDPVTRTRYRNPESMPSRLAARPARPAKSSQPGAAATRSGRHVGPLSRLQPARWTSEPAGKPALVAPLIQDVTRLIQDVPGR